MTGSLLCTQHRAAARKSHELVLYNTTIVVLKIILTLSLLILTAALLGSFSLCCIQVRATLIIISLYLQVWVSSEVTILLQQLVPTLATPDWYLLAPSYHFFGHGHNHP